MAIRNRETRSKYSIAEARDNLAKVVREAESEPVELTRRGRPVAVLVSLEEYERLRGQGRSFWEELGRFREHENLDRDGVERDAFDDVRDRSSGREVSW